MTEETQRDLILRAGTAIVGLLLLGISVWGVLIVKPPSGSLILFALVVGVGAGTVQICIALFNKNPS